MKELRLNWKFEVQNLEIKDYFEIWSGRTEFPSEWSGWEYQCKAEVWTVGTSKLQKSWQLYASGTSPSYQDTHFFKISISDPSWAVDLCKVWPWGVYPPWEAELHLWIHGGLNIHIFSWAKTFYIRRCKESQEKSWMWTLNSAHLPFHIQLYWACTPKNQLNKCCALFVIQGYLMKKGRENNQFLPRKFVLSEIDNTIKYYVKVRKWCWIYIAHSHNNWRTGKTRKQWSRFLTSMLPSVLQRFPFQTPSKSTTWRWIEKWIEKCDKRCVSLKLYFCAYLKCQNFGQRHQ